jgi:hypothetical protein
MVYFNLNLSSNESTFEYSFPREFLDKNYEIGLVKLDGTLEINKQMNVNYTNNKFYYSVNGVDQNNNPVKEEKGIDIPNGKYEFNGLITAINGMLKKDKDFFKASLEDGKATIDITKREYSIDFSRQNTLANVFGFGSKVLTHGKHISENKYNSNTVDNIFTWCNLIDDSYVNNRKINSIYKFRFDNDEISKQNLLISIEPRQIIYHKVTSRPNKIIIKLVDINNNLIEFDNINLFIELHMKELKIKEN